MDASPLMANGVVNWVPVRRSISSASRASASAASRSPSWRSTMLRLQASDPIRNSLPVARTSASRWVIHSRASSRSPRDLGTDSEQMERVGATRLVIRGVAHGECLAGEPPTLGDVRAQGHAGESAERLRGQRRIAQARPDLERLPEQLRRALVVAHPERHEAGVEDGLAAEERVATRRCEDAIEPDRAFGEPLLGDPEPIERVREAEGLVRAAGVDEPGDRRQEVV